MNVKHSANRLAKMYVQSLKQLYYHKINKDFTVEQIRRMQVKGRKDLEKRKQFVLERRFIKTLSPFLAYLTAPNRASENSVIGDAFESYRDLIDNHMKAKGIKTIGKGFQVNSTKMEMSQKYDRYEYRFKTIANAIRSHIKSQ